MLLGEYQHSLDDKGRLTVPARIREDLGDSFIITRGPDGCLFAYPRGQWAVLEEKVKSLPAEDPEVLAFIRLFFSKAVEVEVDKQGRVGLPQHLRTYAQIDRDVFINGVSTRVEIWSAERWAEYAGQAEPAYPQMARKVGLIV
ncbi:MAG: division/cell wall cluster transcriptional repressor MraZ [Patescibacteria group bacterium]